MNNYSISTDRAFHLSDTGRDSLIEALSSLGAATKTMFCNPKNFVVYSIVGKSDDRIECYALEPLHSSITAIASGYYTQQDGDIKRRGSIRITSLLKAGFSEDDVEEIKRMGFFLQYKDGENIYSFVVDNMALASLSEILDVNLIAGSNSARDLYLASIFRNAKSFLMTVRRMGDCGRVLLFHKESARPTPLQAVSELFSNFPLTVKRWEISQTRIFVYLQYSDMLVKVGDDEVRFGMRFEVSERNRECIAIQNLLYYRGEEVWFSRRLHQIASQETSVTKLCDKYIETENALLEEAKNVLEKAAYIHVKDVRGSVERIFGILNLHKEFGNANMRRLESRVGLDEKSGCSLAEILMFFVMLPASTDGTFKAYAIEKLRGKVSSLLYSKMMQKILYELEI